MIAEVRDLAEFWVLDPPPGGPSTPSLSQPRARMPVVVTITGFRIPRGCDRPRLTAALRGVAGAGAGLAIFGPDMSGYRADNPLGVMALTEHRDLAEFWVPDPQPKFPPGP